MATQPRASHNSAARSSGKRALPLAAAVARKLGLVPTWSNLQTICLAIEREAELSRAAQVEVAEMLIVAGNEKTPPPSQSQYTSDWRQRQIFRSNQVDRFWFEDSRWREKFAYEEFRERLEKPREGAC